MLLGHLSSISIRWCILSSSSVGRIAVTTPSGLPYSRKLNPSISTCTSCPIRTSSIETQECKHTLGRKPHLEGFRQRLDLWIEPNPSNPHRLALTPQCFGRYQVTLFQELIAIRRFRRRVTPLFVFCFCVRSLTSKLVISLRKPSIKALLSSILLEKRAQVTLFLDLYAIGLHFTLRYKTLS